MQKLQQSGCVRHDSCNALVMRQAVASVAAPAFAACFDLMKNESKLRHRMFE
jgi:hypothetical protein